MTIEELHTEMRAGFERIENRFQGVDKRFGGVDTRFDGLEKRIKNLEARIRAQIKREGKAIRTHFDVMVEKMHESVKLVAEVTAHHAGRQDDHEKRITRLEDPRRT